MSRRSLVLVGLAAIVLVGLVLATKQTSPGPPVSAPAPQGAQPTRSSPSSPPPSSLAQPVQTRIPPFHATATAAKPFPRLLPASLFREYPVVARAYEVAARIPGVLAQQPCYCWCDKYGHGSLLDCFASDHGAG